MGHEVAHQGLAGEDAVMAPPMAPLTARSFLPLIRPEAAPMVSPTAIGSGNRPTKEQSKAGVRSAVFL
jgi:hypothetical protein